MGSVIHLVSSFTTHNPENMLSHARILLERIDGAAFIRSLIRSGAIQYGGNRKGKIYGRLNCRSGKGMTTSNRVFFSNSHEAIAHGYRPCGHCMRKEYLEWKARQLT